MNKKLGDIVKIIGENPFFGKTAHGVITVIDENTGLIKLSVPNNTWIEECWFNEKDIQVITPSVHLKKNAFPTKPGTIFTVDRATEVWIFTILPNGDYSIVTRDEDGKLGSVPGKVYMPGEDMHKYIEDLPFKIIS